MGTPAFCAFASLEPASSPTIRWLSDLLTPVAMVPPSLTMSSSAAGRVMLLRRPVSRNVCPASGPSSVRRFFAHVADVQAEDEAPEGTMFACFDGGEHIIRAFGFDTFQGKELVARQAVVIGNVVDVADLYQLLAALLADSFHVHDGDEVEQAFEAARRALLVRAIGHGLVGNAHDGGAAQRAVLGQVVDFFVARAAFDNRLDHLGDDFARALHQDPVADAQVFALDIALVVQGGARNHDAANIDGLEQRPGIHRAGTPDVHTDIEEL